MEPQNHPWRKGKKLNIDLNINIIFRKTSISFGGNIIFLHSFLGRGGKHIRNRSKTADPFEVIFTASSWIVDDQFLKKLVCYEGNLMFVWMCFFRYVISDMDFSNLNLEIMGNCVFLGGNSGWFHPWGLNTGCSRSRYVYPHRMEPQFFVSHRQKNVDMANLETMIKDFHDLWNHEILVWGIDTITVHGVINRNTNA